MPAGSFTGGAWSPTADRSTALAGHPASGVGLAGPDSELRLHEQLLLELRLLGRELTPTRDAGGDLVVASGEVPQPVDPAASEPARPAPRALPSAWLTLAADRFRARRRRATPRPLCFPSGA